MPRQSASRLELQAVASVLYLSTENRVCHLFAIFEVSKTTFSLAIAAPGPKNWLETLSSQGA
jgi:hypothetical protein